MMGVWGMYFLVDYENVRNNGLRGTEYLTAADNVIIFYSAAALTMEQRHLINIQKSGCGFEIYKLVHARKNALDFYIATKVGELFGANCCRTAVLVTNDTGFNAIREFWQGPSGTKNRIVLAESIEHGIVTAGENSERARTIRAYRQTVDIGKAYAAYQEDIKRKQRLQEAFDGTAFVDRLNEIDDVFKGGKSPKVIYLDSLRRFGLKDGLQIYRILKTCTNF
jgi:hypothetical protein